MIRSVKMTLSILFCILFLSGCAHRKPDLPQGLIIDIPEIPSIDIFSNEEYQFECSFADVDAALYRENGEEIEIAKDDPRIIRLLNFVIYSKESGLSTLQQGYLKQDTIDKFLSCNYPMLEIIFSTEESAEKNSHPLPQKIVVCGDSYLLYVDSYVSASNIVVERWWPYGELVHSRIYEGTLDSSVISFDGWGNEYWLDILVYCGFNSTGKP